MFPKWRHSSLIFHDAVNVIGRGKLSMQWRCYDSKVYTTKFSMVTPKFKNENPTCQSWNTILGYTAHKSSVNNMDICQVI